MRDNISFPVPPTAAPSQSPCWFFLIPPGSEMCRATGFSSQAAPLYSSALSHRLTTPKCAWTLKHPGSLPRTPNVHAYLTAFETSPLGCLIKISSLTNESNNLDICWAEGCRVGSLRPQGQREDRGYSYREQDP